MKKRAGTWSKGSKAKPKTATPPRNDLKSRFERQLKNRSEWPGSMTFSDFDKIEWEEARKEALQDSANELKRTLNDIQFNEEITDPALIVKFKKNSLHLIKLFDQEPALKFYIQNNPSYLVSLVILLKYNSKNLEIVNFVLAVINQLSVDNDEILTHFCVKGVLTSFTDMLCDDETEFSVETKLYIAWFIRRVLSVDTTFQMLFTCCGLPLLVELIVPDYGEENKELNRIVIDCIYLILEAKPQKYVSKEDALVFFSDTGLLFPLGELFINMLSTQVYSEDNRQEDDSIYMQKMAEVFKSFSVSKELNVRKSLAEGTVPDMILECLKLVLNKTPEQLSLLTCVRHISNEFPDNPSFDDYIENLLSFVQLLIEKDDFVKEIFNQVTRILFSLCKLKASRQESAAQNGLVKFCMFVIENNKPLREFAIPLLCGMSRSAARLILLKQDGVGKLFKLLNECEPFFAPDIVDALASCMENERDATEKDLIKPENLKLLAAALLKCPDAQLLSISTSLAKIISLSILINVKLGQDKSNNGFIASLKERINGEMPPQTRVIMLQMLQSLKSRYQDASKFLVDHGLVEIVKNFAENDSSMLVKNVAKSL